MIEYPNTPVTLLRKMAQVSDEDERAWAQFVELYTPVMRAYFQMERIVSESDVDDLVQDCFIRLVKIIRDNAYDRSRSKFRTFLSSIMRHILIDRYRHLQTKKSLQTDSIDKQELLSPSPDAAEQFDLRWRIALRKSILDHIFTNTALSPLHRDIYRAYVIDGVPSREVSTRFGVTEMVVRQVKSRINRMATALEQRFT